jgi:NADH-quinone oxidoreductase subunit L
MISAILTAIMALVANDLKRVLAYSTVSQLGYMVFAIGCGGVYASQFHLFSHSIFKALLFLAAGAVIHSVGTRDMRQMGALGKQMPLTRFVFVIGSLALAGIPVLNGFWSKELVLEAGLQHGPIWAYAFMLLSAGLTAFYTFRMVYMVFYGKPSSEKHVHDAQPAMKVALIPLAAGALLSWLLAGPFSSLLHNSLPAHEIHAITTTEVLMEVLAAPATYIALAVVALGLIAWWQRQHLGGVAHAFRWLTAAAENSFGFEAVNAGIVRLTLGAAQKLRTTQTGLLNWNIAGLLIAFIAVILILVVRG